MLPRDRPLRRLPGRLLLVTGIACIAGAWSAASAQDSDDRLSIEKQLVERVRRRPNDASAWRMLGHLSLERELYEHALGFLEHAVELNDLSASAWFDLGRAREASGFVSEAAEAYTRVLEIAADSEYGPQAETALGRLADQQQIQLADYRVREFNGFEHVEETPQLETAADPVPPQRLRVRLDTGVLFDSNVALSPLSRNLSPGNTDSWQFFLAPDLEYQLTDLGPWRTGPRAAGNFTWNEPDFDSFNLQSYRPGWFIERDVFGESIVSTVRIDYEYSHDQFAGETFGNRHAVVTSGTLFWNDVQATSLYWSSDYTNFANDGAVPSITSQDGWTNAIGVSQERSFTSPYVSLLRFGGQIERADTTGSDALFNGIGLNAEIWVPIAERTDGTLRGGWGIRDYPDFVSGPARDETLWSAAAEIRHRLTDTLSVRGVFTLDRFVSDNPLFDTERMTAGVILVYAR